MRPPQSLLGLVGGLTVLTLAGCTDAAQSGTASAEQTSPGAITVGAASSLTDVFEEIIADFTAATGVPVRSTYAGSSTLAEQLRNGAPIDVYASAGTQVMAPLRSEGWVDDVTDFATNSLIIAVPSDNPGGVVALADLARVGVVVCAEQVPCGKATTDLFTRAELVVSPVSYEPDARSVLMKIRTDEADAGLVYVTDVAAAEDEVDGVAIPVEVNPTTTYQAAVTQETANTQSAARFVRFLTEPRAQALLAEAGFGPPP